MCASRRVACVSWDVLSSLPSSPSPSPPPSSLSSSGFDVHIIFAHANGFCKETWYPVVEDMKHLLFSGHVTHSSRIQILRCTSVDLSGHGETERVVRPQAIDIAANVEWQRFGEDILMAHDDVILSPSSASHSLGRHPDIIVGVGVSLGGAAMVYAQSMRPIFDHLVLIEPIMTNDSAPKGKTHLGEKARTRKETFTTLEEVRDYYRAKALFRTWDPRAFALYTQHGFFLNQHGKLELKCPRNVEAAIFDSKSIPNYHLLSTLHCPATFVYGEFGVTHEKNHIASPQSVANSVKGNSLGYLIQNGDHLLPMSDPSIVATIIASSISQCVLKKEHLAAKM